MRIERGDFKAGSVEWGRVSLRGEGGRRSVFGSLSEVKDSPGESRAMRLLAAGVGLFAAGFVLAFVFPLALLPVAMAAPFVVVSAVRAERVVEARTGDGRYFVARVNRSELDMLRQLAR